MLFKDIWKYSKVVFVIVVLFIIVQLYYTFRFAALCYYVDKRQALTHPIATEAFPFVIYNMYSGHIDDWGKYSYLKVEADGKALSLAKISTLLQSEQILNPLNKYLNLKADNFNDPDLYSYLQYSLDSSTYVNKIYEKTSNKWLGSQQGEWGNWLLRYVSSATGKPVHSVKVIQCQYQYNSSGEPEKTGEQLVYQYP